MTQHVTESLKLDKFAGDLHLEIVYAGRGEITLSSKSVERPGLALAGFLRLISIRCRVEVLGFAEHEYLRSFPEDVRRQKDCRFAGAGRNSVYHSQPRFAGFARTCQRGEKG